MENMEENCEMICKIWKKAKLNSDKIGKIWKKPMLNSEKIWKMRKKSRLNYQMIWNIRVITNYRTPNNLTKGKLKLISI
jgi:hypothetical protein